MKAKIICVILAIAGGIVTYLSVFHNAFGGASGFTAVFLAVGCCGVFGIPIDEFTRKMDEDWEEKKKIERLNHEWNNAQRKYDRYNGKRK